MLENIQMSNLLQPSISPTRITARDRLSFSRLGNDIATDSWVLK
jgi:hypothetical protein